jgi:hypothetical protein
MSRKSISIVVPKKGVGANSDSVSDLVVSNDAGVADGGVDTWVSQDAAPQDEPAASAVGALTFNVPAEPDWIHVAQSLLVPQVVFWSWTVNTAKKNLARFL